MRSSRRQFIAQVAALPLLGCGGGGTQSPTTTPTEGSAWQQDLDEIGQVLRSAHVRPFGRLPEAQYEARAQALRARLPSLSDSDALCELQALVAALGDLHTSVVQWSRHQWLPVLLGELSDGVFITAVTAGHESALGAEVLAVGGTPIATAAQLAARYMASENESSRKVASETMLRSDLAQAHAGWRSASAGTRLKLRLPDGVEREQSFEFSAEPRMLPRAAGARASLEGLGTGRAYAWQWWPYGSREVLALRYRQCVDEGAFSSLCQALFAELDQRPGSVVVVDLRQNTGGDSSVFRPFIAGLKARNLSGSQRLGVLTDRYTFSAGMDALLDLLELDALHAGEAPGQRPNFLGNLRTHTTRQRGLRLNYPTRIAQRVQGDADAQLPSLSVQRSSAEFFAHNDSALTALLSGLG